MIRIGICSLALVAVGCSGDSGGAESSADDSTTSSTSSSTSTDTTSSSSAGTSTSTSTSTTSDTGDSSGSSDTGGSSETGPAPGCDGPGGVYMGSLNIQSPADVAMIEGMSEITGSLEISSLPGVANIDFLICLETIGGELIIFGNPDLENVDGLANLSAIGTSLAIAENDSLENISSMSGLVQVENLSINNNDILASITGLSSLETVLFGLTMRYNATLSDIAGLQSGSLKHVHQTFDVVHNPQLCVSDIAAVAEALETTPPAIDWVTGNNGGC